MHTWANAQSHVFFCYCHVSVSIIPSLLFCHLRNNKVSYIQRDFFLNFNFFGENVDERLNKNSYWRFMREY